MYPLKHFLLGIILFLVLLPFIGSWALIPFIFSFLIDIDHYIYFIIYKKEFNIIKVYTLLAGTDKENLATKHKNNSQKYFMCIFHTYEFLILIIILSLFFEFFSLVLLGVIFHLILDYIDNRMYYHKLKKYYWFFGFSNISKEKKF
jgi:hypothetical protein